MNPTTHLFFLYCTFLYTVYRQTNSNLPHHLLYIPIFHKSVASDLSIPGIIVSSLMVCSLVIASDELHDKFSLIINLPKRIICNLEYIAVQILEITAVTAPKHFLRRLHNGCPEPFGLLHHSIDLLLRCGVVTDGHT